MDDEVVGLIGIVMFTILVMMGLYWFKLEKCETRAEDMGYSYRYGIVAGCRIKTEQGWIPMENYRQEERR